MLLSKTARLLLGLEEKDAAANHEQEQRRRELHCLDRFIRPMCCFHNDGNRIHLILRERGGVRGTMSLGGHLSLGAHHQA